MTDIFESDPIIVTGTPPSMTYAELEAIYGYYAYPDGGLPPGAYDGIDDGELLKEVDFGDFLRDVLAAILGEVGADALSGENADEEAVSNLFHPEDVVYTAADGGGWVAAHDDDGDGDADTFIVFMDGNGNGIPDVAIMEDSLGNTYYNTGDGWRMTEGGG